MVAILDRRWSYGCSNEPGSWRSCRGDRVQHVVHRSWLPVLSPPQRLCVVAWSDHTERVAALQFSPPARLLDRLGGRHASIKEHPFVFEEVKIGFRGGVAGWLTRTVRPWTE